jgi:glycosyltransferase involved in cell wall biosynthesis
MVTVLLATRNRSELLQITLASLAALDWPRNDLQVVIADNGSTDHTASVVRAWRSAASPLRLDYLYVPEPGKSRAVNAAILRAAGDPILFTDDDVVLERHWVAASVAALADTGTEFVVGRIRPRFEVPPPEWLAPSLYGVVGIPDNGGTRHLIRRSLNEHIMALGGNMGVRRPALDRLGGLCEELGKRERGLQTGEDHEFFERMLDRGFSGVYEPNAVVEHWVPANRLTRAYFMRWSYQNGRDVCRIHQQHPPRAVRLLGVPRYLWREAACDLLAAIRPFSRDRFAHAAQAFWFAGYLRARWSLLMRGISTRTWSANRSRTVRES